VSKLQATLPNELSPILTSAMTRDDWYKPTGNRIQLCSYKKMLLIIRVWLVGPEQPHMKSFSFIESITGRTTTTASTRTVNTPVQIVSFLGDQGQSTLGQPE
jgi:hypothetical protein